MTPVHRHVALVGFMGSGKSTLGSHVAARIGSPLTDIDADLEGLLGPIADYFREHGETAFRGVEESAVTEALLRKTPSVVVLGGGAVTSLVTRGLLGERATTLWLDVDVETCWERVRGAGAGSTPRWGGHAPGAARRPRAGAAAGPHRNDRRARRRLYDGRGWLRRRDLPPRHRLDARADEPRRAGRRRDRRQDRDRP